MIDNEELQTQLATAALQGQDRLLRRLLAKDQRIQRLITALHAAQAHPDYTYITTSGLGRTCLNGQWTHLPPEGKDGWKPNPECDPDPQMGKKSYRKRKSKFDPLYKDHPDTVRRIANHQPLTPEDHDLIEIYDIDMFNYGVMHAEDMRILAYLTTSIEETK